MLGGLRLTQPEAGWRLRATAAVAGLVLVATSSLSSALAVPAGRLLPVAAVSAIPALLGAGFMAPRLASATIAAVAPATLLAAGLPVGLLAPEAWPQLLAKLGGDTPQGIAANGRLAASGDSIAAVMLMAGVLWTAGALLGASGAGGREHVLAPRLRSSLGFVLLAGPWLASLAVRFSDHAAWQGGVVLVAGVLWFCSGWAALTLAVAVAMPSAALARAVGPSSRWFGLGGASLGDPPFRTLDTDPTYGPLDDRRTGATMLTITAPAPALWRVQTLDYIDGHWIVPGDRLPALPEPGAAREEIRVRVIGLRENLAVSPGRIDAVTAVAAATPTDGEGMVITPTPAAGSTYHVEAAPVRAGADQLSRDRLPLSGGARAYTRVGSPAEDRKQPRSLSWLLAPFLALVSQMRQPAVDPRVVALARKLSRGAGGEWDIVARVERYLVDGGRFRYTTAVAEPGPQPLADFLLRTHAGYCQQFAGAAALLLRLAGVPARVAVGFATGTQVGPDRYAVRDVDAHEWIEVYFPGYGWVPFNPTPAADPAAVANGIDPLSHTRAASTAQAELTAGGLSAYGALMAVVGAAWILSRRVRRRRALAGEHRLSLIARRAGGEIDRSTTLAGIGGLLAARIGPRTAAIAYELERARFAAHSPVRTPGSRVDLARALLGDLGVLRSLLFWLPRTRRPG
jgi:transglutaminase-like putative cysteine protease